MDTAATGPRPAPAQRLSLSAPRQRVLELVAEAPRGVTIANLTRLIGGHPNTARMHLDQLADAGLVEVDTLPPEGRGRPARRYKVTSSGERALRGEPVADYETLVIAFAEHLVETGQVDRARDVGRTGAARLDLPVNPDPEERLTEVLEALDFSPQIVQRSPEATTFVLRSCPFVSAATEHPEVICGIHRGLLESLDWSGRRIALEPFASRSGCRVHLAKAG